jgi:hypothetical protein
MILLELDQGPDRTEGGLRVLPTGRRELIAVFDRADASVELSFDPAPDQ